MEPYKNFVLEDFAADPWFRSWVLAPNEETDQFWKAFLERRPEKKAAIHNARILVLSARDRFQTEEANREQLERYYTEITEKARQTAPPKAFVFRPSSLQIAAAIITLAIIGATYLFYLNAPETKRYQTNYGERKGLELPDGTVVQLNANSQLEWNQNWRRHDREVWLEGEAFFTVAKIAGSGAKFIVHTQGLDIEVLGTQFNVNTRQDSTRILLEEGKIKLLAQAGKNKQQELYLNPGELAAYSKKTGQITRRLPAKIDTYLSWKDGYLLYDKATIEEVIQDMQATYGVQVQVADPLLLATEVHAALPTDNFDEFLEMVETLFDVKVTQSGDTIRLEENSD